MVFSRLNANRRHDKLLRLYLVVMRERAEAQLAGSSKSRAERLAVRERALAGAVRSLRLHLGLPDTFDPELESARLGIDGKRARPSTQPSDATEHRRQPRIMPRPVTAASRHDAPPRTVTVADLLDYLAAHAVEPESEILVRSRTARNGTNGCAGVNVVAIELTGDGRVQLDIG